MQLLLGLLALSLVAQTPLTGTLSLTGPALAKAGTPVTVTVTLTNGGGPAAVQWDMSGLPAGATVTSSVTGKTANCTATRCILVASVPITAANGTTPIPDGAVATITYTQPAASATVALAASLGASSAGAAVTVTPPSAPLIVPVQSNCDVNGDGKVDATDVGLVLQSALAATGGTPSVLDVLREIIAANGGSCLR